MKLSAVLLAGGESHRMGRDKATALFRGRPLWNHQLELLRAIEPLEIFISARTDPPWRPPTTIFVRDLLPRRGPLGGLAAALTQTKGTHLLALAVDMPLMTASFLKSISDMAEIGQGILPTITTRAEALAAIYPADCANTVSAAVHGEDFSLQQLTKNLLKDGYLRVVEVHPAYEPLFRSLNTPEDLRMAEDSPASEGEFELIPNG